jgi:hypothetical protein
MSAYKTLKERNNGTLQKVKKSVTFVEDYKVLETNGKAFGAKFSKKAKGSKFASRMVAPSSSKEKPRFNTNGNHGLAKSLSDNRLVTNIKSHNQDISKQLTGLLQARRL